MKIERNQQIIKSIIDYITMMNWKTSKKYSQSNPRLTHMISLKGKIEVFPKVYSAFFKKSKKMLAGKIPQRKKLVLSKESLRLNQKKTKIHIEKPKLCYLIDSKIKSVLFLNKKQAETIKN